ncbi:hypothetical protein ACIPW5_26135 [Streptomyces sp. NPDC090077]|uniref:competence protein CoiA family protein n=1 Tax=Streptomyces sp. NPDC090077 TaxID=3365938 RepID=UPI00382861B8
MSMVFVGTHAKWGRIDATLLDLGCGQDRAALHHKPAPVTCRECGWRLHLVHVTHGGRDLWHLRHADNAPQCTGAKESMARHLLKLDLAWHARDAGAVVELEARADDGSWTADALATMPDGRRVALEAQLAPKAAAEIEMRTARYAAAGVEVCWFSDRRKVPWLDSTPAVQLARAGDGGPLQVVAGAARFVAGRCLKRPLCEQVPGALPCAGHGGWEDVEVPLDRFVAALCRNTVRPYRLRVGPSVLRWVTRPYFGLEAEQLAAAGHRERAAERLAAARRREEQDQATHMGHINALLQRQATLAGVVSAYVHHETGQPVKVGRDPDPAFAMGVSVTVHGELYGVICPVASRIPAQREQLDGLVLFAATEREADRITAQAPRGQRVVVLQVPQQPTASAPTPAEGAVSVTRVGQGQAAISIREAVRIMTGVDRY